MHRNAIPFLLEARKCPQGKGRIRRPDSAKKNVYSLITPLPVPKRPVGWVGCHVSRCSRILPCVAALASHRGREDDSPEDGSLTPSDCWSKDMSTLVDSGRRLVLTWPASGRVTTEKKEKEKRKKKGQKIHTISCQRCVAAVVSSEFPPSASTRTDAAACSSIPPQFPRWPLKNRTMPALRVFGVSDAWVAESPGLASATHSPE